MVMQDTIEKAEEFRSYIEYYITSVTSNVNIKVLFTGLGGSLLWLMGDVTPAVVAFIVIYMIDFILGIGIALYKDEFNPSRFFAGIVKIGLYFFLVILAHQFDIVMGEFTSFGTEHGIGALFAKYWVIGYLATHEFLSALVKMKSIGIPIPEGLVKRIRSTKKKIDEIT